MRVNGTSYRTVWMKNGSVHLIDQNLLPFEFTIKECRTHEATAAAIKDMAVRGAPAIGAAAGFAMAQAFGEAPRSNLWGYAREARQRIEATRLTARDLFFATESVWNAVESASGQECAASTAIETARRLADESVAASRRMGELGRKIIPENARILTHCNAGWLANVDYGSATAPIYSSAGRGNMVHIWVGETRPRSQGARLTAWELHNERISHQVIADNAAGHLMSRGDVDLVITGADRIARNGDVANKVGTLEKAICAKEFRIPFYAAAPLSTFDFGISSGDGIPIEHRSEEEVLFQSGPDEDGVWRKIRVAAPESPALNPAFDVTPARYITGIITERGIFSPGEWPAGLLAESAGQDRR